MRETDRKKTLEIFVLIHTCKGPGIPTACCFHKTQFAWHGLECQMSNCGMTKLQTLLPEYFGQVSPICQDFSPISTLVLSVYPSSCRMQMGAEHNVGLLYNTEELGEDGAGGAGSCHQEHKHQGALTQVAQNSSSVIFLSVLFSSSKGQGENPHCQGNVYLPRPRLYLLCFIPSALLTVHLPTSTTLCSQQ